MARLQYSFTCLGVEEDKGPPSFLHVFQTLPCPSIPFRFPPGSGFFVVTGVLGDREPSNPRLETRLLTPSGAVLLDIGTQILRMGEDCALEIQFLDGLELPEEGRYEVQILLEDQEALRYPLWVTSAD